MVRHLCKRCESVFLDRPSLWRHKNIAHKIHPCQSCGLTFTSIRKVVKHEKRKHGVKSSLQVEDAAHAHTFKKPKGKFTAKTKRKGINK